VGEFVRDDTVGGDATAVEPLERFDVTGSEAGGVAEDLQVDTSNGRS
jgi:hypothetical protein